MHLGQSISRRRRRIHSGILSVALAAALAGTSFTASSAFTTTRIASGLNRPVFVTEVIYPGVGDLLYIVGQTGFIWVMVDGVMQPNLFLDIDALVPNISGNDERGLLGMALDPDFVDTGEFYLNYTDNSGTTQIVRYQIEGAGTGSADPLIADASSPQTVLSIGQPFPNHNGGCLQFGRNDDYLYVGTGDGGSGGDPGNRAQNGATLLGKMLRIDVRGQTTYAIPPDNPFVGNPAFLDEIWDYGLRNPWRYSFDKLNGDLYIADVGQNNWEEVDFEPFDSGGAVNYGWRLMEGAHCFNPPTNCDDGTLTYPIHEYSHSVGISITGGHVYRGSEVAELYGEYFFADFGSARIWSLTHDGSGGNVVVTDRTSQLAPGGGLFIGSISSFGEGPSGELYICDRGGATTGEIFKLVPDPADAPEPDPVVAGLGIQLRSSNPFTASSPLQFAVSLQNASAVDIDVVGPHGQHLRTLASGAYEAGSHTFSWDGRSDDGRTVSSGIFFLRARSANQTATQKIQFLQ
jgi:glucose/arabinose dehydrogenase